MTLITIPQSDLQVHPLCLGGNVFGFSADTAESIAVLNEYQSFGGNFVDTADVYSEWKPGNVGHESEVIIGKWMKVNGNRADVIVATKVAKLSTRAGLSSANITAALEDSLRALQTDYIDIYYAHADDESVPMAETLKTFTDLIQSGKVRYIAASNFTGARLEAALTISEMNGFAKYIAVQNEYNLITRKAWEDDTSIVAKKHGISGIPWYGLARGFLTGKYRPGVVVESVRSAGVAGYQDGRGWAIIGALDIIAKAHNSSLSAIALAWLRAQSSISVPIASARTVEQLREIIQVVELTTSEIQTLTDVSR